MLQCVAVCCSVLQRRVFQQDLLDGVIDKSSMGWLRLVGSMKS